MDLIFFIIWPWPYFCGSLSSFWPVEIINHSILSSAPFLFQNAKLPRTPLTTRRRGLSNASSIPSARLPECLHNFGHNLPLRRAWPVVHPYMTSLMPKRPRPIITLDKRKRWPYMALAGHESHSYEVEQGACSATTNSEILQNQPILIRTPHFYCKAHTNRV